MKVIKFLIRSLLFKEKDELSIAIGVYLWLNNFQLVYWLLDIYRKFNNH